MESNNFDNTILVDNHHLEFVKSYVNPINQQVYVESYTTLARARKMYELDSKLSYLQSKIDTVDSSYIPLGINTIFKEVFRNNLNLKGVYTTNDIELSTMLSLWDLLLELENHDNIADVLRDTARSDFDIVQVLYKLDLDVVNIIEHIKDYEIFIDRLYSKYVEEIEYGA